MSSSKRDQLVRKALEVFYRNGFHATGMDKLAIETGVSKTAMYKHFRTKGDLILAVLRLRDEEFRNWFSRRIDELASAPKAQLVASFDVLGEWFSQKGFRSCMFIKASSEYQDADDPIHVAAAEHKRLLLGYMSDLARTANATDPEMLARQLLLLQEGAIVTAHLQGVERIANDARAAAVVLIDNACDG